MDNIANNQEHISSKPQAVPHKINKPERETGKMPVLFVGHGSPMNAALENEFTEGWRNTGASLPKPSAIVCISAHWETQGTLLTAMKYPRTIHDFGGFPEELYKIIYPAPGNPGLAEEIRNLFGKTPVQLDYSWGLDHGTWSVLRHIFPDAGIPVIQMSLDYNMNARQHYGLAREMKILRNRGILIIGSGNMVHNLTMAAWDKINEAYAYDWVVEAGEKMKTFIINGDFDRLINYEKQGTAFELAIPSPEHYLPLLYALALKDENEEVKIFNDKPVGGSLTMTSLLIDSNY